MKHSFHMVMGLPLWDNTVDDVDADIVNKNLLVYGYNLF